MLTIYCASGVQKYIPAHTEGRKTHEIFNHFTSISKVLQLFRTKIVINGQNNLDI